MHNQSNNAYSGKNHSSSILEYGVLTSDCKTISSILSARFSFSFCISVDVRFCFLATPYKSVSPDKFFSTTFTESLGVFDFLSGVRVSQGLTKFTESLRVFEILTGVFSGLMMFKPPSLVGALAQIFQELLVILYQTASAKTALCFVTLNSFWLQSNTLIEFFHFRINLCVRTV